MNNQQIQAKDQAGHTKLTLVSSGHGRNKIAAFIPLRHDAAGQAILPSATLDKMLTDVHCTMRGQTYWVG